MSKALAGSSIRSTICNGGVVGGAGKWLSLAAAPTFAVMALMTAFDGGQPDMVRAAAHGASPLSGMTAMYALMSTFHLAPWLTLLPRRS